MPANDYRHVRVDPGFLFGRAHGLTVALIRLAEGVDTDSAGRAEMRLMEAAATPARLAVLMARTWARLGSQVRRDAPKEFASLEQEYARAMAGADIESLPERLPSIIDDDALATWSAAAMHGYHHELLALSGRSLQKARAQQTRWIEAAKAAALEAIAAGVPEAEAARRVGLDRMTLRKAQGK